MSSPTMRESADAMFVVAVQMQRDAAREMLVSEAVTICILIFLLIHDAPTAEAWQITIHVVLLCWMVTLSVESLARWVCFRTMIRKCGIDPKAMMADVVARFEEATDE